MQPFTISAILGLAFLGIGCHPPSAATPAGAAAAALRDSLIALDSAMNDAVDHLDCTRGMSYIGDERPVFISGGHVVETHEQLLTMCQDLVAPRTSARFVPRSVTAHILSPDVGYVVRDGQYIVHYRSGETRTEQLAMTTIWARDGGSWKMMHLHESAIRP